MIEMKGIGLIINKRNQSSLDWILFGILILSCVTIGFLYHCSVLLMFGGAAGGITAVTTGYMNHAVLKGLREAPFSDTMSIAYTLSDDGRVMYFDSERAEDADPRFLDGDIRRPLVSGPPYGPAYTVDPSAALLFNKKSEALSLILSLLLPGLGQIYNGQTTKGVVMLVAAILIAIFGVIPIIPLIAYIVLWFYGMYDAYTTAKEYNAYLLSTTASPRGEGDATQLARLSSSIGSM